MKIILMFILTLALAVAFYDYSEKEKRTYRIKTIPYDSSGTPMEFISIVVQDDELLNLINTGKATISSTHTPGETIITIHQGRRKP